MTPGEMVMDWCMEERVEDALEAFTEGSDLWKMKARVEMPD